MGTNFYLHTDFCPCCGQPRQKVHLGKRSSGLRFLFHKIPNRIFNYKSFCSYIKEGVIYDEYNQEWEAEDLINNIQSLQKDKEHPDAEHIDGYDFLSCDFC